MSEAFQWAATARGFRAQVAPNIVDVIDAAGLELAPDADTDKVVAALHSRGLGFLQCILGLMAIKGVSLGDAKLLVHISPALADTRSDRETGWAAMSNEIMDASEVQARGTATETARFPKWATETAEQPSS